MRIVWSSAWRVTVSLGLLCGCGDDSPRRAVDVPIPVADEKAKEPASPDKPSNAGADNVIQSGPFRRSFDGISFSVPKGWQEVKLAESQISFIDARFLIETTHGPVELTCLSNRGGIEANMTRWVGQFQLDPDGRKADMVDVDGVDASWLDLAGTFNSSSSGKPGPHPDWRMLGVGIPLGGSDFYLKLNGPKAAVAAVYDDFREFVRTAKIDSKPNP